METVDGLNELQQKIADAIRLLVEARELARRNGEIYRQLGNLPVARRFENLTTDFANNIGCHSVGGLTHYIERFEGVALEATGTTPVSEDKVKADLEYIFRYLIAFRKVEAEKK